MTNILINIDKSSPRSVRGEGYFNVENKNIIEKH